MGASGLALIGIFTGATVSSLAGVILKQARSHTCRQCARRDGRRNRLLRERALGGMGDTRTLSGWGPILYLAVAGNLVPTCCAGSPQWRVRAQHQAPDRSVIAMTVRRPPW